MVAYVEDACRFYLQELRCDGLRWDATKAIKDKPGGWDAMREILWNLRQTKGFEKKILIAEQLPYEKAVVESGNFHSAWWVEFHHSLERELGGVRSKGGSVEDGINGGQYSAIYKRVVYSSGHDEARNGSSYLPSQFSLEGRNDWDARAKCRLISSLQFCIPGIPMIWQGEEFLQDRYFNDEYNFATNWKYQMDGYGLQMQALYKDILRVRKDHTALRYGDLIWAHCREANNVLAFLRRDKVNGQTILVVVNCGGADWVNNHSYGISTGGTFSDGGSEIVLGGLWPESTQVRGLLAEVR